MGDECDRGRDGVRRVNEEMMNGRKERQMDWFHRRATKKEQCVNACL